MHAQGRAIGCAGVCMTNVRVSHAGVDSGREAEYLVKWTGRAHAHSEWLPEAALGRLAKRKLANFKRRHGGLPCCLAEAAWSVPERLVARRPSPTGPGWEVLVKWCRLGYEHATWEVRPHPIPSKHSGLAPGPDCQGNTAAKQAHRYAICLQAGSAKVLGITL